jgi:hypothetical protein
MTALNIRPAMADSLDKIERRRRIKQAANLRYRDKRKREMETLRKEVASLTATLQAVSGILHASAHHPKAT